MYAAKDLALKRRVAVKVISPHRQFGTGAAERFERETRICAQLTSDHVAHLFDAGTDATLGPFVVLELLDGRDLAAIIKTQGPIPIDVAVAWILQACDALAEAHALGIVHRDVKPSNLFLAEQAGTRIIKVLDFGIARFVEDAQMLTKTGALVGTPQYMSPEQLTGRGDIDARSDLWSLAVTLYELVTAAPIFDVHGGASFGAMVLTAAPTPLRARMPSAPVAIEQVIATCLQRDREHRFPNVVELARALAPFAGAEGSRALDQLASRVSHQSTKAFGPPMPSHPSAGRHVADAGPTRSQAVAGPTVMVPLAAPRSRRPPASSRGPAIAAAACLLVAVFGGAGYAHLRARRASTLAVTTSVDATAAPLEHGTAVTYGDPSLVPSMIPTPVPSTFASLRPAPTSLPTPPPRARPNVDASAPAAATYPCGAGQDSILCNGVCVSGNTDAQCGACGVACRNGEHCRGREHQTWVCASCPPNSQVCSGNGCIDLRTSPMHCGACFQECKGKRCAAGKCVD